jgi:hypothetical protein
MRKPPFFIVGVGRSGTTLLRLMMHNHPNLAIPYESHFITDYYRRANEYGDLKEASNVNALVSDILQEELLTQWDCEFSKADILARITEPTIASVFDAIYSEYAKDKGKIRWGDKSDYLDRIDIINRLFPDAKFIHIVRDGRDVASSVMKMTWGPKDLIRAAEWWHEHVRLGRAMGGILGDDRYIEVRYEDLVNNSREELARLCAFLDEPFAESMLEYYKAAADTIPDQRKGQHYNVDSPPNAARTYAWKNEMTPLDVAVFNSYARHSLSALGYELEQPSVASWRIKLKKVLIFAKRFIAD